VCIFRWQTIGLLTRVSPPSQKTIYSFKLVVGGHTTKQMKHGCSCNTEKRRLSVENVALGLRPRTTFSTSGSSYFNVTLTTVHHLYNVYFIATYFTGIPPRAIVRRSISERKFATSIKFWYSFLSYTAYV